MPFCHAPWTNIDVSPQGVIGPCCKFEHRYYGTEMTQHSTSLEQYESSTMLQTIKQEFKTGTWPKGCERCRIEEDNGIASKRQLDYERWKSWYDSYDADKDGYITASIAFGNTCNLRCITCGPACSSAWNREYRDIHGVDIRPNHFYRTEFMDQLTQRITNVIHLDIPGGEPFLSGVDQQQIMLEQWVRQGRAGDISLHYTTNATIFPDQEWWDLWQHFRNVDIQLSIDGVADRYQYIRYPAQWSVLCDSVHHYQEHQASNKNLQLSVSHTVSAYNVYYLPEFLSWCEQQKLPRPWLGRVHRPVQMQPTSWCLPALQSISHHLSQSNFADARLWGDFLAKNNTSEHFDTLKTSITRHDRYRNTDFCTTFPELAKWINQ